MGKPTTTEFSLSAAFELQLPGEVIPGMVTAGHFLAPASSTAAVDSGAGASASPPPGDVDAFWSLAFLSSGQRIFLHCNDPSSAEADSVTSVAIGREVTSLSTAAGIAAEGLDALLIGTSECFLTYDVGQHRQGCTGATEDRVLAAVHGNFCVAEGQQQSQQPSTAPVTLVGGNCAVYGYDTDGEEVFWAVAGDQVTSLALLPWPSSAAHQPSSSDASPSLVLLVGSEDASIRAFQGTELLCVIDEVAAVLRLTPEWSAAGSCQPTPASSRFAYILRNHVVGVYDGPQRVWRMKGREPAVAAVFCDVDGDGESELVVAWQSGRLEIRNLSQRGGARQGGEVLYRHEYGSPLACVLSVDYRHDGRPLPIVCTTDGHVEGIQLHAVHRNEAENVRVMAALQEQHAKKEALAEQLSVLDRQLAASSTNKTAAAAAASAAAVATAATGGSLSTANSSNNSSQKAVASARLHTPFVRLAGTRLYVSASPNPSTQRLDVRCQLSSDNTAAGILSVVLFLDPPLSPVDTEDTMAFLSPEGISTSLLCPLAYERPMQTTIRVLAQVGEYGMPTTTAATTSSSQLLLEEVITIPPFVMCLHMTVAQRLWGTSSHGFLKGTPGGTSASDPYVTFFFSDDLHHTHLASCLRSILQIPNEICLDVPVDRHGTPMDAAFDVPIAHAGSHRLILVEVRQPSSSSAWRTFSIKGANVDWCADFITHLSRALQPHGFTEGGGNPSHMRYYFEAEGQQLSDVLRKIGDCVETRSRRTVSMADTIGSLKSSLFSAEDARLLREVKAMRRHYASAMDLDRELLVEATKQREAYASLRDALKDLNVMIQRAGQLRVDEGSRSQFIQLCRDCVREERLRDLVELITRGVQ